MVVSGSREKLFGLLLVAIVTALTMATPFQSRAEAKVWDDSYVVWSSGGGPHGSEVGSCRITLDKGIACSQNYSPFPKRFTHVNLRAEGRPFLRTRQKFPAFDQSDPGRQIYPVNRPRWSRNGVDCRVNRQGGVKCSNGEWAFLLSTDSYLTYRVK